MNQPWDTYPVNLVQNSAGSGHFLGTLANLLPAFFLRVDLVTGLDERTQLALGL